MKSLKLHIWRRPEVGAIIATALVLLVFSWLSQGKFIRPRNIASVLAILAEQGLPVLGLTLAMIGGEIDLSVGSMYGMGALLFVILSRYGLPTFVGFFVVLFAALIVGVLNGLFTVKARVPSMITTLGMMFFLRGMIYFTTRGFTRSFGTRAIHDPFLAILAGRIGNSDFRISIIWFAIMAFVFWIVLEHMAYGNHVLAVGGKRELAQMMGVRVDRIRLINFILSATMAAMGGVLSAARFRMVSATHGEGLELAAIAATVTGGTLLTGGYGTIPGAVMGALLISSLRSGLLLAGAPSYWYIAFMGMILIAAASVNMYLARRWFNRE